MPQDTHPGFGLLILGLLSFPFGPFAAIPGLLLAKRYRPFSPASLVGYWLCWISLALTLVVVLVTLTRIGRFFS